MNKLFSHNNYMDTEIKDYIIILKAENNALKKVIKKSKNKISPEKIHFMLNTLIKTKEAEIDKYYENPNAEKEAEEEFNNAIKKMDFQTDYSTISYID